MKILFVTDTHLSAKSPRARLDSDIISTFMNKFVEIISVAKERKVEAIFHGGDFFHTPDVSNRVVGEVAKIINNAGIPFYVTPGNHDIQGQNIESLRFTKLGLLADTGVVELLTRDNVIEFDHNIFVHGQEYYHGIDGENTKRDYEVDSVSDKSFNVLIVHSMLLKDKFHAEVHHTLTKDVKTSANVVLSGHYHNGFDPHRLSDTLFINPGSAFRGDLSAGSDRIPQMLYLEVDEEFTTHYELIPFKVAKPFNEIFDLNLRNKRIFSKGLEEYNTSLGDNCFNGVNILDVLKRYVKNNEDLEEYFDLAEEYILKQESDTFVSSEFSPSNENIQIVSVEMENFQKHNKLKVDFTDGVNVILGSSNVGKTAILRAINWCLYDTPKGTGFIRTGSSFARVTLTLSNGYIVTRRKTNSSSGSYIVVSPTGERAEYKGFSNNVPSEVINAHQMPLINILDKKHKFNVASQMDLPFMVSSSSSEKFAMIGALVDTTRADKAHQELRHLYLQSSKDEKAILDNLSECDEEINSLGDLDHVESIVKKVDDLIIKQERAEKSTKILKDIASKKNYLSVEKERLVQAIKDIPDISSKSQELQKLISSLMDLNLLKEQLDDAESRLKEVNFKVIEFSKPNLEELGDVINKLSLLSSLKRDIDNTSTVREAIKKVGISEELSRDREDYIQSMKRMKQLLDAKKSLVLVIDEYTSLQGDKNHISKSLTSLLESRSKKLEELSEIGFICKECNTINILEAHTC